MKITCSCLITLALDYGGEVISPDDCHPIRQYFNGLMAAVSSCKPYNISGFEITGLDGLEDELKYLKNQGSFRIEVLTQVLIKYNHITGQFVETEYLISVIRQYLDLRHRYRFRPWRLRRLKYALYL